MNLTKNPKLAEVSDVQSVDNGVPLVVDLDGTLSRSDTLHEAILGIVAKQPAKLISMFSWLREGKAGFKARVVAETELDVELLPLRDEVIDEIKRAKVDGRPVFLVSASHQKIVDQVADHVDLFDEAKGSDATINLAGKNKAHWLVERFGENGFDYIGDSNADLDVWPHARKAITAGANSTLKEKVEKFHGSVVHLQNQSQAASLAKDYIKAMRPHQWLKNLLVFVPALAAHDMSALLPSLIGFFAFCFAASCIYLINDMLDLSVDRRHPRKRHRPFASGAIPVRDGAVFSAVLALVAFSLATLAGFPFVVVLCGYVLLTFAYSLILKRKLMIDIWTLGVLYTIRIISGGAASGIALSEWLLAFSMFIFLSLAAVKRLSELADMIKRGKSKTDGRGYQDTDLPVVLGVVLSAGYCSVLILALYVSNATATGLYSEPRLFWLVCPLLLYWISRATIISYRGEMDDDPILFAVKDRISQLVFLTAAVLLVLSAQL